MRALISLKTTAGTGESEHLGLLPGAARGERQRGPSPRWPLDPPPPAETVTEQQLPEVRLQAGRRGKVRAKVGKKKRKKPASTIPSFPA